MKKQDLTKLAIVGIASGLLISAQQPYSGNSCPGGRCVPQQGQQGQPLARGFDVDTSEEPETFESGATEYPTAPKYSSGRQNTSSNYYQTDNTRGPSYNQNTGNGSNSCNSYSSCGQYKGGRQDTSSKSFKSSSRYDNNDSDSSDAAGCGSKCNSEASCGSQKATQGSGSQMKVKRQAR